MDKLSKCVGKNIRVDYGSGEKHVSLKSVNDAFIICTTLAGNIEYIIMLRSIKMIGYNVTNG